MPAPAAPHRSPTPALLLGLAIPLATVVAYSWYISREIAGLQRLQTDLTDRSRRSSLQLLRIQNDLNELGHAMSDMLDAGQTYPVTAWQTPFDDIRRNLEDALERLDELELTQQTPEQRQYLATSFEQFWNAADRIFALAASDEAEARVQIQLSLQERRAALHTAVARALVQNNESEEQISRQVQDIYGDVQRQVYWFLAATLAAIVATSLYLMRSNRRLFARMATLSDDRRQLAQTLIATRESTLREIARELHDELGQILTAIGSMLGRAHRQTPADSPVRHDLREIGEVAQTALDSVRGLSQTLHPSILEELGLESAIDWYVSTAGRQLGLTVTLDTAGAGAAVDATTGIHVYRILQEALGNVARHAGVDRAAVRLRLEPGTLELDVEDHGRGLDPRTARRGLGLVTMRERAEIVGGTIAFERPAEGGTRVRLRVPRT
jgi:signal transduction histidine kinase